MTENPQHTERPKIRDGEIYALCSLISLALIGCFAKPEPKKDLFRNIGIVVSGAQPSIPGKVTIYKGRGFEAIHQHGGGTQGQTLIPLEKPK